MRPVSHRETAYALLLALCAAGSAGAGCAKDTAQQFASAMPHAQDVALAVPGSQAATGTAALGLGSATPAPFYEFTRAITDGVDGGTLWVLGTVWYVVHQPPASESGDTATWGPWTDALSPVTYRFTVKETATDTFDYALDGRPKASTSDADFVAVLSGTAIGDSSDRADHGNFTLDLDEAHQLDPVGSPGTGKISITYQLASAPRTIDVDLWSDVAAGGGTQRVETKIGVQHDADGSGSLSLATQADIDHKGALEDVSEHSEWLSDGAGRADVTISGGDLSTTVLATECWGTDFSRVYYHDDIGYQPDFGTVAACAFAGAM